MHYMHSVAIAAISCINR
uniref:Uncharacterized protein n=1 Tax=Anguilla anguilla TaxID=7936 RepID=A0A0E9S690_ANGAN